MRSPLIWRFLPLLRRSLRYERDIGLLQHRLHNLSLRQLKPPTWMQRSRSDAEIIVTQAQQVNSQLRCHTNYIRHVHVAHIDIAWTFTDENLHSHIILRSFRAVFSPYCITGWAVALTCYISQSTKHWKMADFDPSGRQNSWTHLDEIWHCWLRFGPQPTWQLWWGSVTWVVWANMWLVTSLNFFSFFLLLSSARARVAFLNRSGRSIRQKACFRPRLYLLSVSTIFDYN